MKFSVSSSALLSLLATTGKVISNKNTLPILDYFLMELKGDELRVTTSDLETTLVGSIRVDGVESEGTIAAPAKLMLDSLKEFAEMPLTIEVNDQNWEIRLSWKSGSLSIPGASAVSYPAIPALSADCKELTLDVDVLVNGINKTIFATADDATSALDLYYQQHLLRLLKRLTAGGQLHVCVVLHDLNLAALWADRILLLHQGHLVAQGTPQEVIQQPVIHRWYGADVRLVQHPDNAVPQVYLAP